MSIFKSVFENLWTYLYQIFYYETIVYTGADDDTTKVVDSSDHANEDIETNTL